MSSSSSRSRDPQAHVDLAPRVLEQPLPLGCGRLLDARALGDDVFRAALLQRVELRRQRLQLGLDLGELRASPSRASAPP